MTLKILQADLFSKSSVGSDADYNDLLEQINSVRLTKSTDRSNDGCWRGMHRYNIDWLLKEVQQLASLAFNEYAKLDFVFAETIKDKTFSIDYWTNINQPNSRNVIHSHIDSCLSCVYYVQGTGTGDLRLINPANILASCNPAAPFTRDTYFNPKDRDLILWPSWIPHEVEPNLSLRERINVVFDIRLT